MNARYEMARIDGGYSSMLEGLSGLFTVVVIAILIIAAVLLILSAYGRLYHRVGPNRALIIYGGAREPQVVKGGGRFVVPLVQRAEELSLELMSFDVAPQQDLYTNQGVSVRVEAVTQLKVRSDRESILTAAEQFLSKTPQDRENLIRLVMEGHLRGIVGQLDRRADRQRAGDGRREDALHQFGGPGEDGPRGRLLHHQAGDG